jgi:hypothetical protein
LDLQCLDRIYLNTYVAKLQTSAHAGLLGSTYTPGQVTYDLRRLRLAGLIRRLPQQPLLTDDGIRIAIFYTKTYNRLLMPLTAADQPQAPTELRHALNVTDHTSTTSPSRLAWSSAA